MSARIVEIGVKTEKNRVQTGFQGPIFNGFQTKRALTEETEG
jgi:hypothetical protein